MEIIGLTGPIKHGKTTFANAVEVIDPTALHIETGLIIAEVADAFHEQMPFPPERNNIQWMNKWLKFLPGILKDTVHVDTTYKELRFTEDDVYENPKEFEKFYAHAVLLTQNPELSKQAITTDNKETYRPILQWLGGYLVSRVSPIIWNDEIFRRVDIARESGAKIAIISGLRYESDAKAVKKHGGTIVELIRPDLPLEDIADPTERERSKIKPDITVRNLGTVKDLEDTAAVVVNDVVNKKAKNLYLTTEQI